MHSSDLAKQWFPVLLVLPLAIGYAALQTDWRGLKLGEPAMCGLLLLAYGRAFGLRHAGYILAAFAWSMIGDYFLSSRGGRELYFVYGIGAFFVAHLGYLGFALKNGRLSWLALALLLLGYLPFFAFYLHPAIQNPVVRIAALAYLLISCVSMAAAFGLRWRWPGKILYGAGIGLVLFSDTLIAFSEFLHERGGNRLILPTYYLAHLCVTLALFWREENVIKTLDPKPALE
jgi:uncharacterized membrane protein YhhN